MNLFQKKLLDHLGCKQTLWGKFKNTFSSKQKLSQLQELPAWANWSHLMDELNWLHARLRDDHSRTILENTVLYHLTGGAWKVKWRGDNLRWLPAREEPSDDKEKIQTSFLGWELQKRSLYSMGFPIKAFLTNKRPNIIFDLEQYSDPRNNIYVQEGDVVIDGGSCWGDSALYFSYLSGSSGNVYSYEFMPENLSIMQRNLELNPELARRINIIEKPLWSKVGVEMEFLCDGPATRINKEENSSGILIKTQSTTIDELVENNQVNKIDFIKMDIEGAELEALKGAENSIRKFKPRMALCVYHRPEHFTELARYIDNIHPEYMFSLDHMTTMDWETVLYASPH